MLVLLRKAVRWDQNRSEHNLLFKWVEKETEMRWYSFEKPSSLDNFRISDHETSKTKCLYDFIYFYSKWWQRKTTRGSLIIIGAVWILFPRPLSWIVFIPTRQLLQCQLNATRWTRQNCTTSEAHVQFDSTRWFSATVPVCLWKPEW